VPAHKPPGMVQVQISPSLLGTPLPDQIRIRVEEAARRTLADTNAATPAELTIVITNDDQLKELNREFLNIDATTDVLSFPVNELDLDSGQNYLGDVLISYPQALQQAKKAGHSVEDELCLLTVHGVLHLLGYDHIEQDRKEEMWAVQAEILAALGCSPVKLPDT